ncbi:MAG: threonine/serine dehydratase [Ardenticatenaceae bacterium]|nr:threonine/serine dehydratase [Ardenticatenaceae bacterium]
MKSIRHARERIRPYIRQTYLDPSPFWGNQIGGEVLLKCENYQHTGSFKVRGALNKVLALTEKQQAGPFVTASTGNHGAAFGYALSQIGGRGIVYVPENASPNKLKNISRWDVEIRTHGHDGAVSEQAARAYAHEHDLPYISPYNDPEIVAGQGTIGIELTEQSDPADVVYVALGGGGLISGIAAYLKQKWPSCRIIGCSPKNSAVMIESQAANRILDLPSMPTLSDGTAGGVEPDSITFDFCRDLVDGYETVTEDEIATAMRFTIDNDQKLIEGAAGVAIAAMYKQKEQLKGKKVIVVLCGGNVSVSVLKQIL